MRAAGARAALALGLWAAGALAGDAPAPLLLRLHERFYTAAELGVPAGATDCRELEPLIKAVVGPLLAEYHVQNRIVVAEADLQDYCRRQLPAGADFAAVWAEWRPDGRHWRARQEAVLQLTVWKLHRALHAQYGGRVVPGGPNPPQAFDAIVTYVAEREAAGDFTIHDARLRLRFWECLRTPPGKAVSAEEGRAVLDEHPADRRRRLAAP